MTPEPGKPIRNVLIVIGALTVWWLVGVLGVRVGRTLERSCPGAALLHVESWEAAIGPADLIMNVILAIEMGSKEPRAICIGGKSDVR